MQVSEFDSHSMELKNDTLVLTSRPAGVPDASHFETKTELLDVAAVPAGHIVVQVQWLGFQPSQLKAMQDSERACMQGGVEIGSIRGW